MLIGGILFHLREDESVEMSFSEIKLEQVKYRKEKEVEKKKAISTNEDKMDEFCDLRNTKHFYSDGFLSMSESISIEHYCVE